jgi:hypothetical protein
MAAPDMAVYPFGGSFAAGKRMRELFQSCTTLAFSMSLLSVELIDKIISMERREFRGAANALEAVSNAAVDQLGPRLRSTFGGVNDIQRSVVGMVFDISLNLAKNTVNRLAEEDDTDRPAERPGIHAKKIHSESDDYREDGFAPAGEPSRRLVKLY